MPGPAPKPRALRILEGTHPERINHQEPVPISKDPECPPEISPAVREIWDFTTNELRAMRTLHRCDRDSLLAYCHAVENHRQASRLIAQTAVLINGVEGKPIRNPALAIQRDNADLIRKFAQEFGLTPSARSRIRLEETQAGAGDYNPFSGTGS